MTIFSRTKRSALWPRLLLLFLLEVEAALGIFLLLQVWPALPYLSIILLDSAWLGLVSGLGTRLLLKGRHWALRSLAAVVALFSGLFLLGLASGWHFGLGPQEFKAFDLAGATQVATGLLASLLAATAWRKPVAQNPQPAKGMPAQPQRAGNPVVAESSRPATQRKPKKAAGSQSRGGTSQEPGPAAPKTNQAQKAPVVPATESKPVRRKRRPKVQFASTEEHRCPYCLEIVQPDDPRGIVECKICHTLHHADCWAITGACQVPHLNI